LWASTFSCQAALRHNADVATASDAALGMAKGGVAHNSQQIQTD